ncbi:MAG: hypothetical protein PHU51_05960 [Candidatus Nanoarchaeia archaeon]|nr:hypothetical protein [Candidatus Nanoarchaeia archaeon]
MVEHRMIMENVLISVWLNGDQGNVILAPGIPQQFDKYHPFVEQMSRLKYNLFIPHYIGTRDSLGDFTIANSTKSVAVAIRLAKKGEFKELFSQKILNWNCKKNYLMGFSYGALPSLLQDESIDKTILICPFISLQHHLKGKSGENVEETFRFLERAYPKTYGFKTEKVLNDLSKVVLPKKTEKIIVVRGLNDISIPQEELDYLNAHYDVLMLTKEGNHTIQMTDSFILKLIGE